MFCTFFIAQSLMRQLEFASQLPLSSNHNANLKTAFRAIAKLFFKRLSYA